jgi:hypothetical protein
MPWPAGQETRDRRRPNRCNHPIGLSPARRRRGRRRGRRQSDDGPDPAPPTGVFRPRSCRCGAPKRDREQRPPRWSAQSFTGVLLSEGCGLTRRYARASAPPNRCFLESAGDRATRSSVTSVGAPYYDRAAPNACRPTLPGRAGVSPRPTTIPDREQPMIGMSLKHYLASVVDRRPARRDLASSRAPDRRAGRRYRLTTDTPASAHSALPALPEPTSCALAFSPQGPGSDVLSGLGVETTDPSPAGPSLTGPRTQIAFGERRSGPQPILGQRRNLPQNLRRTRPPSPNYVHVGGHGRACSAKCDRRTKK